MTTENLNNTLTPNAQAAVARLVEWNIARDVVRAAEVGLRHIGGFYYSDTDRAVAAARQIAELARYHHDLAARAAGMTSAEVQRAYWAVAA
jgi:hypothetical protein